MSEDDDANPNTWPGNLPNTPPLETDDNDDANPNTWPGNLPNTPPLSGDDDDDANSKKKRR